VLGELHAVHSSAQADVSKTRRTASATAAPTATRSTSASTPWCARTPKTGRKALYVNVAHTTRFAGMTEEESRPLLEYLFAHSVRPELTCRFQWQVGSLAMWDNRATMHNPINDYHGYTRRMHRISLAGDVPF